LLRAHRVADGVWGNLVVHSGTVTFVFDDDPDRSHHRRVRRHRGDPTGTPTPPRARPKPATFAVEFHRVPTASAPAIGTESSAFDPGSGDRDGRDG
jgi:hypothetical protein